MKKIITALALLLILTSCGYRKEKEVALNFASNELEYKIWIYKDNSVIGKLSLPLEATTKKQLDSLNLVADSLIKRMSEFDDSILP
jgi:hypothetical protein